MSQLTLYNRRDFLRQTSALTAAAALPARLFAQTQAPAKIPGRDTQLKFNPDGSRRPFAGNTVICHLPAQCAIRDAMVALRDDLLRAPFLPKLGLTSTDSYHMTVFSGANDQDRTAEKWPSYVPLDAPIAVCNDRVGERMAKARLIGRLPFRVRVDEARTVSFPVAMALHLVPADEDEDRNLRSVRDQLALLYGFRTTDHATYEFHITMSYQVGPFTASEQSAYREMLQHHLKRMIAASPVLELGMPEYCTFPDMFLFTPRHLLACS